MTIGKNISAEDSSAIDFFPGDGVRGTVIMKMRFVSSDIRKVFVFASLSGQAIPGGYTDYKSPHTVIRHDEARHQQDRIFRLHLLEAWHKRLDLEGGGWLLVGVVQARRG